MCACVCVRARSCVCVCVGGSIFSVDVKNKDYTNVHRNGFMFKSLLNFNSEQFLNGVKRENLVHKYLSAIASANTLVQRHFSAHTIY